MGIAFRAEFKNGDDVRVIKGRGGKGLALETKQAISIGSQSGRENFDRDPAPQLTVFPTKTRAPSPQLTVFRQIHLAHSAFANLRADFITAESGSGCDIHLVQESEPGIVTEQFPRAKSFLDRSTS